MEQRGGQREAVKLKTGRNRQRKEGTRGAEVRKEEQKRDNEKKDKRGKGCKKKTTEEEEDSNSLESNSGRWRRR